MREVELPAEPDSVAVARAAVHGWGLPEPPEHTATLLVSELVTNAVKHAGLGSDETIGLRAKINGDVRVEVCDPGEGFFPRERSGGAMEPGGWGLVLVESLAARWGVQRDGGRTCVWFEFPLNSN